MNRLLTVKFCFYKNLVKISKVDVFVHNAIALH
jgi:hypothetical protein